jgi:tetratricopeptide (TPR) repeat protein
MLETIREYAAERLDDRPELAAAARRAHAAYFADFARRQWEHLTGRRRELALAAMTTDLDNLRAAWDHWVAAGDLDQLNKLVDSLWLLYDARGWYHDTLRLTTDLLEVLSSSESTPDRTLQEVTLRTSLARALMATKGYTPEVEEVYARTLELFEGRQVPQLFPVLRNLGNFHGLRGEYDKAARMARAILRLGEEQQDASMLVDGHLNLGATLTLVDDLHAGLEHLDKALAYFRSEPYPAGRYRLGNNPGVVCLTTSAFILWILGYPDRGLQRANEAIDLATGLEHPFTLAYALFHAGYLHLWRREADLVRDRAERLLQLMAEHDFPIWRALGTCLLGAADTATGQGEAGLARVRQGMDLYQGLKTPPVFWPHTACPRGGRLRSGGQGPRGAGHDRRGPGDHRPPLRDDHVGGVPAAQGRPAPGPGPGRQRRSRALVPLGVRHRPARGRQDVAAASRSPALPAPVGPGRRNNSRPATRRLRHLHRRLHHGRSD